MGGDIFKDYEDNVNIELPNHPDIKCGSCKKTFTKKDYENYNIKTYLTNHSNAIDADKTTLDDNSYITTVRLRHLHEECEEEEEEGEEDE